MVPAGQPRRQRGLVLLLVTRRFGRRFVPHDRDQDRRQRQQALRDQQQARFEHFEEQQLEASKTDWRPLVSYTSNLARVGRQLLGTDACWEKISKVQPTPFRKRFLATWSGPQYPWYWSAGVLAGLFGLSAFVLSLSVRSLDRLR